MTPPTAAAPLDDLLTALEARVRRATEVIERLRRDNERLSRELESAAARLADWKQRGAGWERERDALGARLERLLCDIDALAQAQDGHHEAAPSGAMP
ncbi:MAG: cell division protein ZapB [Nitrospirota bacterium]